ncbi:hypothetical protein [uncultured Tenacibaculum sp.]|uniref:hypothetical protein n=1 Tax=uncultured Tenacibaculum sp. TaxID=174713 RepID=UPI002636588A|nr:hypothetical protein [uncultured Tenacibaculum sp.]
MKSLKLINKEIKDLTSKFKDGDLTHKETICKFQIIINDLKNVLGENNKALFLLQTNFIKTISRLEKYKNLTESFTQEIELNISLRKKAGLPLNY